MRRKTVVRVMMVAFSLAAASVTALAQQKEAASSAPNILVIMGDDIGYWNLSTYNQGMMGYRSNACCPLTSPRLRGEVK